MQMYSTNVDIALALGYAKLFRELVIVIVNDRTRKRVTAVVSGIPTALVYISL